MNDDLDKEIQEMRKFVSNVSFRPSCFADVMETWMRTAFLMGKISQISSQLKSKK